MWRISLALCTMVGAGVLASPATAQSFRLDRLRSAERPDDAFGVRRLGAFGHLRFGANALLDYANDPLVIKRNLNTNDDLQSVVDHELVLKVDLSLALWDRVLVLAGFDAPLWMEGPERQALVGVAPADGAGFGDLSLGLRARLFGEADDVFALGLSAVAILPTAGDQAYRGEDGVAVRPELIADVRTRYVRVSANVGVLARKKVDIVDRTLGSELLYGLALGVPVHARVELLGELSGGFDFEHFAAKTSSGLEWLLGAKANTESGFYFGAGIGTGLTHGLGTPDVRALGQFGYLTPLAHKEEEPAPADRDQDGVLDQADHCPDQPEDRDGHQDEDGCPEPDNDSDGVLDVNDGCASEAEDRDGYADEDGCPEPDNDNDTLLDADDACPNQPGPVETRGCPVQTESEMAQLEQIQFENNKDTILPASFPVLESVRATLEQHPEIKRLRIEGHTDGVGEAPYNMRLSRGRTSAVAGWLTSHGVDPKRLEAQGCGELYLIADDATPEGRAKNRRVEFQIVDPAPDGAKPKRQGCTRVDVK